MAQNVRVSPSARIHVAPAVLAAVGAVASVWTPWPLMVVTAWAVVAALAVARGLGAAFAAGSIVLLAGALVVGLAGPFLPGGLLAVGATVQVGTVLACSWIRPGSLVALPRLVRADLWPVLAAMVVPVTVASAALLRGTSYSWAVWNDAVVQLHVARQVVEHGGTTIGRGQPDPVVSTLLGWAMSSGRQQAAPGSVAHDGAAQAVVVFGLVALLGALFAACLARSVPRERPWLRVGAALGGSLLSFSWLVSGVAVPYGFINSLVALVLLGACWLVWTTSDVRPRESVALLSVATVVMLGTWPVLALVPVAMAAAVVVVERADLVLGVRRLWVVAGAGILLALGALVAVPTLTRPVSIGAALADGAFVSLGPMQAAVPALIALVVAAVAWRLGVARREVIGVVVVLASAGLGLVWFIWERRATGGEWWYYYPQKLSWMVGVILLVAIASVLMQVVTSQAVTPRDAVLGPVAVLVTVGAVMAALPPRALSVAPDGWFGALRYVPVLTLATEPGDPDDSFRAYEVIEPEAEDLIARDGLIVLSRATGTPQAEQWANDLELADPVHEAPRTLRRVRGTESLTTVAGVCEVAEMWGGPMTVITARSALREEVQDTCPEAPISIELVP